MYNRAAARGKAIKQAPFDVSEHMVDQPRLFEAKARLDYSTFWLQPIICAAWDIPAHWQIPRTLAS